MLPFILTRHAERALEKRAIALSWVERVILQPLRCEVDRFEPTLEHRLCVIETRENRVLRVIIDARSVPVRVITAYFDRSLRGTL